MGALLYRLTDWSIQMMHDLDLKIRYFLGGFAYTVAEGESICEKCYDQFPDAAQHLKEEHRGRYLLAKIFPRKYRPYYL